MPSMTGFGKAVAYTEQAELRCELRSVNNRYLDISLRLPKEFAAYEKRIRDAIKQSVHRGKVTVSMDLILNAGNGGMVFSPKKLKNYYNALLAVKETLHLNDEITLNHILNLWEDSAPEVSELSEEEMSVLIINALNTALEPFNRMRKEEGAHLLQDMQERLAKIVLLKDEITERAKENVQKEFDKLYANVLRLIGEQKIDRQRLEQEVAILSDRVDITEECVRLDSHINLFKQTIKNEAEVGKKLTFILQEMLREVNTINSKNSLLEIQHKVIRMKEEIEKIREQAQNLE